MCAHAHHERKVGSPLRPSSRALEALRDFDALSCYLSLNFKRSDTKKQSIKFSGGGGGCYASSKSVTVNGCVYHLSQVRNTFQYPLSKGVCKRLPKRLSRVVAFIIELYREYESGGRPCHYATWSRDHVGRAPLRRSLGDINAFQNDFAFLISTETCFWLKRVTDRTFSAFQKVVFNP